MFRKIRDWFSNQSEKQSELKLSQQHTPLDSTTESSTMVENEGASCRYLADTLVSPYQNVGGLMI